MKVTFGLTPKNIEIIEADLLKYGSNFHSWKKIGEKIGWCPLTACCFYEKYKERKVQTGKLCFCTYPINKSDSTETDLFFCLPLNIGDEYSTCILFNGSNVETMRYKGTFSDVCTADLTNYTE